MIERVVVGWDGSPEATDAARWAAARQRGRGPLELVRVLDADTLAPDWETTGGTVEGAARALEEEVRRLARAFPDLEVEPTVLVGRREAELVRLSRPDTLLVLGTEERLGAKLRFRFSLAVRLAARAAGPVAVVPGDAGGDVTGPVVVGVDGSAAAAAATRLAAEEAVRLGTSLVAVHAWWGVADWDGALPADAGVSGTVEESRRAALEAVLDPIAAAFPGLRIEPRLVHGPRTAVLLAEAEGACELVVGKHGRTVARDLLLGTVSRDLLLDVWVPTLVVGAVAAPRGVAEPAASRSRSRSAPSRRP